MPSITVTPEQQRHIEEQLAKGEPVRVTLAFEKQLGEGWKFRCHSSDLPLVQFINIESGKIEECSYPLPINTEVEVQTVCDRCKGYGYRSSWSGQSDCSVCLGKGTTDTGLRLKTTEEPWCTSWYAINRDVEIDGICPMKITGGHTEVASYECTVSKVKVKR